MPRSRRSGSTVAACGESKREELNPSANLLRQTLLAASAALEPASARLAAAPGARPFQGLELVERLAGAQHDAGQRGLRPSDLEPRFGTDPLVDPAEQRSAAGEDDPPIADVGGELGRGAFERVLDGGDDPLDRSVKGVAELFRSELEPPEHPALQIAASDLAFELLCELPGRAGVELRLLGRLLPDQQPVGPLAVLGNRPVHLVAADLDRLRADDPAERDDADLGR